MTLRLSLKIGYGGKGMEFYTPLIFQTIYPTLHLGKLEMDHYRRGWWDGRVCLLEKQKGFWEESSFLEMCCILAQPQGPDLMGMGRE